MRFHDRFMQFMSGRRGFDATFHVLVLSAAVLAALNILFRLRVLQLLVYLLIVFALYRFFSKNLDRRERENNFVLEKCRFLAQKRELYERRRNDRCHVYKKCPSCKAILRLPRRKGVHTTVCPKCGKEFKVKVRK